MIKQLLLSNTLFFRTLKATQRVVWKLKAIRYRRMRSDIRRRIAEKKEPIEVLFFITSMSMWRYHELFCLLKASPRFKPLIIPYFTPHTDLAIMRSNRDAIEKYARENEFEFRDGFDFTTQTYSDLEDLNPDIVVYSQPYDWGYKKWGIDAFAKRALFIYTPYGTAVSSGRHFYDTPLGNVASLIFVSSDFEKRVYEENLPVNHSAIVVSGSEIFDKIKEPTTDPWPQTGRKRIIWAPHHSIDDHNSFASSYFEALAEPMLAIAEKYKDTVDFAFKPHPLLRTRLYEKWGKERTDGYYAKWELLFDGAYTDLFAYSDAIIHDGSAFVAQYLYTGNPALYITESETPGMAINNLYGTRCFDLHYHGHTPAQIEKFINNVVISGNDPLKPKRQEFVASLTLPDSTGKKMFDSLSQF